MRTIECPANRLVPWKETRNPLSFPFLSKEENEKLTFEIAKLLFSDHAKAIMRAVAHRINKDINSTSQMFFTMLRRLKNLDDKSYSSRAEQQAEKSQKEKEEFEKLLARFNISLTTSRTLPKTLNDQIILEVDIAHRKDMAAKEAEINGYNDRLADMREAREELIKMGEDGFQLMKKSLYSIITI
ncbi:hypothetical protein N7454_005554 [Penicillium verhagenii]|nr:hypothetical protein N7454_005554 [Penicillium verhagenii]